MRNPFKRVYCEDCKNMMPATQFSEQDLRLECAKCKADPKKNTKRICRITKITDYWYCSSRLFPFCFKFEENPEEHENE
ncbi:MAG: hypothetical protein KAS32_07565 [Candidatus Peribacteraceae bacterium]|nr:hypothetical protein [Candidatus Peribacteraceae bacterium]